MKKGFFILVTVFTIFLFNNKVHAIENNADILNNNVFQTLEKVNTGLFGDLEVIKCGTTEIPKVLADVIRTLVNIIKIAVPIVLVVLGMIDMAKSVIGKDEKQMSESKSKFIKRILAGLIIFFVFSIIQLVIGIVAPEENDSLLKCLSCMVSDKTKCG